jgi:hypothetical protein
VYGRVFAAAPMAGLLAATVGDMAFLPICFEVSPRAASRLHSS